MLSLIYKKESILQFMMRLFVTHLFLMRNMGCQYDCFLFYISIESVMPSNHLIFCRPLLLLPSIFPSIRVFSNESVLHIRWPEYYNFSFNISLSNEYLGLISFRIDWFDLATQGTLKSLLQYHSSNTSILQLSVFLFALKLWHWMP